MPSLEAKPEHLVEDAEVHQEEVDDVGHVAHAPDHVRFLYIVRLSRALARLPIPLAGPQRASAGRILLGVDPHRVQHKRTLRLQQRLLKPLGFCACKGD